MMIQRRVAKKMRNSWLQPMIDAEATTETTPPKMTSDREPITEAQQRAALGESRSSALSRCAPLATGTVRHIELLHDGVNAGGCRPDREDQPEGQQSSLFSGSDVMDGPPEKICGLTRQDLAQQVWLMARPRWGWRGKEAERGHRSQPGISPEEEKKLKQPLRCRPGRHQSAATVPSRN